ncbi:hypothetical protein ACTFIT_005521 [Dictyostelium discoideum]
MEKVKILKEYLENNNYTIIKEQVGQLVKDVHEVGRILYYLELDTILIEGDSKLLEWVEIMCPLHFLIEDILKNNDDSLIQEIPRLTYHSSWFPNGKLILNKLANLPTPGIVLSQFCNIFKITLRELNSVKEKDEESNTESVLHLIVNSNNTKTDMKIDQIRELVMIGTNINIMEYNGIEQYTILDCAASKKNIELFKALIDMGAGENAARSNNFQFYKELSYETKIHIKPYMKKLLQRNLMVYNKLCFEQLFPNINYKIKTASYGIRSITHNQFKLLFSDNNNFPFGSTTTTTTTSTNTNNKLKLIEDEKLGLAMIVEFEPKFPTIDKLKNRLIQGILGLDIFLESEFSLIKFNKTTIYPILIKEHQGSTKNNLILHDLILSNDTDKLNNLDSSSISKLIVSSIVVNPSGGTLSDFIVSLIGDENNKHAQKYKLIPINTGSAFSAADKVGTFLYFLKEMNDTVHSDVIDKIEKLDVHEFLSKWFGAIPTYNLLSQNLVSNKKIYNIEQGQNEYYVGAQFQPDEIRSLYSKLFKLKSSLLKKRKKPITHWKLLEILEPITYYIYKKHIEKTSNQSLIKRCEEFYQKQNVLPQLRNYNPNLQVDYQMEIDKIKNEENLIKNLKSKFPQNLENKFLFNQLTYINAEKLFKSLDFSKLSKDQFPNYIKNLFENQDEIRKFQILNCKFFTTDNLLNSKFLNSITKLSIVNCSSFKGLHGKSTYLFAKLSTSSEFLKLKSLVELKIIGCKEFITLKIDTPNLKYLSTRNCPNLSDFDVKSPKLKKLEIQGNMVGKIMFDVISNFKKLKYLDINLRNWEFLEILIANNVTAIEKIKISNNKKLKVLDLDGCSSLSKISSDCCCNVLETLKTNNTIIKNDNTQLLTELNNSKTIFIYGDCNTKNQLKSIIIKKTQQYLIINEKLYKLKFECENYDNQTIPKSNDSILFLIDESIPIIDAKNQIFKLTKEINQSSIVNVIYFGNDQSYIMVLDSEEVKGEPKINITKFSEKYGKYKIQCLKEIIECFLNKKQFQQQCINIEQTLTGKIDKELNEIYSSFELNELKVVEILNKLEGWDYNELFKFLNIKINNINIKINSNNNNNLIINLKKFYFICKIQDGDKVDFSKILKELDRQFPQINNEVLKCSENEGLINFQFTSTILLTRIIESGCLSSFYWFVKRNPLLLDDISLDVDKEFQRDGSPICFLVRYNCMEIIRWLKRNGYLNELMLKAAILKSCSLGKMKITQLLLDLGADYTFIYSDEDNLPLSPIFFALNSNNKALVILLVEKSKENGDPLFKLKNSRGELITLTSKNPEINQYISLQQNNFNRNKNI